jgi:hypothetical protein
MRLYPGPVAEGQPSLRDYLTDGQLEQLAAVLVRLVVATADQQARRAANDDAAATKSAARG